MNQSLQLRTSDLSRLLRLAAELDQPALSERERGRRALSGLAEIVRAEHAWITERPSSGGRRLCTARLVAGASERERHLIVSECRGELPAPPFERPPASRLIEIDAPNTRPRPELVGTQDVIESLLLPSNAQPRSLQLERTGDAPPFSREERDLVHLFHLELANRLLSPPATTEWPQLSPRQSATLECLLGGASEKEVAGRLGLSPHTVHQYVKMLYRRFGVSSRAQLLARCLRAS
jgi:DNA-binding CsgD family transcriptional regulator